MNLTAAQRYNLEDKIAEVVSGDPQKWDVRRQERLLRQFGRGPLDGFFGFDDELGKLSDQELLVAYGIVTGSAPMQVAAEMHDTADDGAWQPDRIRLFISHSAKHKEFVSQVADFLADVGVHGFVAHETMQVAKPWEDQIRRALRTMDACVALVHPEFNDSIWCQQEVGWALGRSVPTLAIRLGQDPQGFLGRDQAAPGDESAQAIARRISGWLANTDRFHDKLVRAHLVSLGVAGSYIASGFAAEALAALGGLSADEWRELDRIYWANDQVFRSYNARKALDVLYSKHRRKFPPVQPPPSAAQGTFAEEDASPF